MKGFIIKYKDNEVTSSLVVSNEFGVKHKVLLSLIEATLFELSKKDGAFIKLVSQSFKEPFKKENRMYVFNKQAFRYLASYFKGPYFYQAKITIGNAFEDTR